MTGGAPTIPPRDRRGGLQGGLRGGQQRGQRRSPLVGRMIGGGRLNPPGALQGSHGHGGIGGDLFSAKGARVFVLCYVLGRHEGQRRSRSRVSIRPGAGFGLGGAVLKVVYQRESVLLMRN
jgi:hypothetical protein